MEDIVCVTLSNGVKLPVIGYSMPTKKSTCLTAPLERALNVGYRHVAVEARSDRDLRIGQLLKSLFDSNEIKRQDIFISMKLHITAGSPECMRAQFLQRLCTLSCDYIDLLLLDLPTPQTQHGDSSLVGPASNMRQEEDSLERLWQVAERVQAEGYTRSLGLVCTHHVAMLNILQRHKIAPHVISTNSESPLVQKYLPNLVKLCGGRDIQPIVEVNEYYQNGKRSSPQRKLLSLIADEMERGVDQILVRSFLERGLVVVAQTNDEEILERSFQVLDFSLYVEDMKKILQGPAS